MLLTQGAQKFLTKALNNIARAIKSKQEDDLDAWENLKEKTLFSKGEHLGKQRAFETAYHIAKTASDESYPKEYAGADKRLLKISTSLHTQSEALEKIINESTCDEEAKNKILDQANLLKHYSESISLILKQDDE